MLKTLQSAVPFAPDPAPTVAVVRLEGMIARAARGPRAISMAGVAQAVEKAFALPKRVAVALAINSPGGSPVQSRLIHDRIRALSDEKNVPVYAFCEDVAASGGYMLACAGDEIFADASSLVGSIGVVGASFGAHEAIAKLGIERRVYAQGENKVRLDPFQPEKPEDVAFVERIQKAIHEDFIALVKARRGRKLDAAKNVFDGEVWVGRQAKALGLIDGLGEMRGVLRERYGPRLRFKTFAPARASLGQRLLGGAAESLMAVAEERVVLARYGL